METRKVLEINSVPYGSTCETMLGIAECGMQQGIAVRTASGNSTHPLKRLPEDHIRIGTLAGQGLHLALARVTGYTGCFSSLATRRLLRIIQKENYDIVHLHNLHGCYLNVPMLFRFLKKHHIPTVWTLHDCWSFTGHCPHFTWAKCDRWQTGCNDCPQYRSYPRTWADRSKQMWRLKKKWFTGVPELTLVTPSQWLARHVQDSYLKDNPIKVIHNGIDLSVFRPGQSDVRQRYGIGDRYLVLGVSFGWHHRKGLDVFLALAEKLPEQYQIVLVGTDEKTDLLLPENILSIHRTQNQQELAQLYAAADVFVNPSREENYPTVDMEAIACGTPVVTFRIGGGPEIVDTSCGAVVEAEDAATLQREIERICTRKPFSREACRQRALEFDKTMRYCEYADLYKEIYDRTSKSRV